MSTITIQQVSVTYPTRAGAVTALRDLSVTLAAGSFVALVGPSGCGKTTLLRTVGGLHTTYAGSISLDTCSPQQARLRRMVSFLFQQPVLLPWQTVLQNVELPLRLSGTPRQQRRETAHHVLDLVDLGTYANAYPHQLSGGMQQRAALARALSFHPSVFLMDEPFSALDEMTRERMDTELLRVWSATGATVLFVTHSLSEAVFLADRVLVLSGQPGHLVADTHISLPRPRTAALLQDNTFWQHVTKVRRSFSP